MFAVIVGYAALGTRLWTVQVEEHEAWSREARNLVRAATFVPHRRGSLYDRDGRELVRDEELYELQFTWRDFRRGHALGQVTEVRSLLGLRPVSLAEAEAELETWALGLVELSPAAIKAFGQGGALDLPVRGGLRVLSTDEPEERQRGARSAHLHFYVKALLRVDRREARELAGERDGPAGRRPYIERVAWLRGTDVDTQRRELLERLERSRADLARLAGLWVRDEQRRGAGAELPTTARGQLDWLLEHLEDIRRGVEDDAADDLFVKAHGFGAWRLGAANLRQLDLDWLARSLFWDEARLALWIESRGGSWASGELERLFAAPAIARAKLDLQKEEPAERVLNALADVFADPGSRAPVERAIPRGWRKLGMPAVLAQAGRWPGGARAALELAPALPLLAPELLAGDHVPDRALELVVERTHDALGVVSATPAAELAGALAAVAARRTPTFQEAELALYAELLQDWNQLLQSRIGELLERLGPGRVRLAEEWVDSALEERAYVVRDRGSRPQRLFSEPDHDLVQLVTRFPREFAGFGVRATTRRVPLVFEEEGSDAALAHLLVGSVRSPFMTVLLRQYALQLQLTHLQQKRVQSEADGERIEAIVAEVYLPGEMQGGAGIEGYFDDLLRGQNGYRETRGLQDKRDGGREALDLPPRDGLDLRLSLDTELQRAAQYVLEHPAPVPSSDDKPDRVWWRNPVGAIALITPGGDVLAAASTPLSPSQPGRGQDGESLVVRERTLTQPRFQPPGSVFKPFVAAWALEFADLDPLGKRVPCDGRAGHARYGKVRCWLPGGHGAVNLGDALQHSCNCYFAWLGESLAPDELRMLSSAFGFGRPTGVRIFDGVEGAPSRLGLNEQPGIDGPLAGAGAMPDSMRQRLGNGLAAVTATPLQVARAYAGLATGELPELRLLDAVLEEGRVVRRPARAAEKLPFSGSTRATIRDSLVEVVRAGTAANKGLGKADLGFVLAAKTGSADYKQRGLVPEDPDAPLSAYRFTEGTRKHTWLAGWFPARDPRAIVVVYVHDTSTTSSHSAAYLARQFLAGDAVQSWYAEQAP